MREVRKHKKPHGRRRLEGEAGGRPREDPEHQVGRRREARGRAGGRRVRPEGTGKTGFQFSPLMHLFKLDRVKIAIFS